MTNRERLATVCVVALVLVMLVVYVIREREKRALEATQGAQLQTFMRHVADTYVGVRSRDVGADAANPEWSHHSDPIPARDWRGTENIDGLIREARLEMPEVYETFSEDLRETIRAHLQMFVDEARRRWRANGFAYRDRPIPMTLDRYLAQFGDRAELDVDAVRSLAERTAKDILRSQKRAERK